MNERVLPGLVCLLGTLLGLWQVPAQAARSFDRPQTPAAALAEFDMGTTQTLTYAITNTSTGGDANDRIYEVRFRLPGTGTVFSSTTAAPAGWARTAFSSTSVTFRATSWTTALQSNQVTGATSTTASFSLVMVMRATTADVTETLRDIRSSYTLDTNFSNGITRTGRTTYNNQGSWTLRALSITSVQTTDLAGTPVTSIFAGTSFRLVITVRNLSSATLNGISVSAGYPTTSSPGSKTGSWTGGSPNCSLTGTSPIPLNLAPGASGTITYTCITSVNDSGTVIYAVRVRNSTNSATSRVMLSNALSVSVFVAEIYTSRSCAYINQTITVTMRLKNNSTSCSISGITPTLAPTVAGIVTLVSGPVTTPPNSLSAYAPPGPIPQSDMFQWTYQISGGTAGQLFEFSGTATGTKGGGAGCTGTITTPSAASADIKRGGFDPVVTPGAVNASSTNQNIEWTITNNGCGQVNKVQITLPAGFAWNGDGYALVNTTDESWTVSGTNPASFDFTGANPIPLGGEGAFSLVLSTPPGITVPTSYLFDIGITEDVTGFSTRSSAVIVNPFGTSDLNRTAPGPWREQYR